MRSLSPYFCVVQLQVVVQWECCSSSLGSSLAAQFLSHKVDWQRSREAPMRMTVITFLLLAVLLLGFTSAYAGSILITEGRSGNSIILSDSPQNPGVISYSGTLTSRYGDSWTFTINAWSKPALGDASSPLMRWQLHVDNGQRYQELLTLEFSDNFFGPQSPIEVISSVSGQTWPPANNVGWYGTPSTCFSTFLSQNNGLFQDDQRLIFQGEYGIGNFSNTANSGSLGFIAAPYSLTQRVDLSQEHGWWITDLTGEVRAHGVTAVPEPSLLLLLGIGLGAVTIVGWSRRK
jgi:hypothetical protein